MSNCQLKQSVKSKCPQNNKCNGVYSSHDTIVTTGKYYSTQKPNIIKKIESPKSYGGKLYDCPPVTSCMLNNNVKINKSSINYSSSKVPNIPNISYSVYDSTLEGLENNANDLYKMSNFNSKCNLKDAAYTSPDLFQ